MAAEPPPHLRLSVVVASRGRQGVLGDTIRVIARQTLAPHRLILRNGMAHHVRAIHPEPGIDRIGRVKGNWRGAWHSLRGRLASSRIMKMEE